VESLFICPDRCARHTCEIRSAACGLPARRPPHGRLRSDLRQVQPPWPVDGTLAGKADLDTVLPVQALRSPG